MARAEAALPRRAGGGSASGRIRTTIRRGRETPPALASYVLRQPTPDTVVVFDCSRFEFDGEDKARIEQGAEILCGRRSLAGRVPPVHPGGVADTNWRRIWLKPRNSSWGWRSLALLLEATGGDASRLAVEIEKLKLLAGDRKVTADDIAALVPDAQAATIFALVAALGRGDRGRALETLDTLSRSGEYMPLALTFLATQFRMALAAREAGLTKRGRDPGALQPFGGAHLA